MKIRTDVGLTFDDVLLVPKRSSIASRQSVNTASALSRHITLNIPIIAANMDTVTETRMAIAMAQQGGIGILHRFMSVERQAECVRKVKRAESMIVSDPITLPVNSTLGDARERMAEAGVGGLMVVDEEKRLAGIVTTRDVLLAGDNDTPIAQVMTPFERLITAGPDENMEDARRKLHDHRIEKLPLLDADRKVVGLITVQDIIKLQEHPYATKDALGRLRVGAAVGVRSDDMERAAAASS